MNTTTIYFISSLFMNTTKISTHFTAAMHTWFGGARTQAKGKDSITIKPAATDTLAATTEIKVHLPNSALNS
jgi:hypothetical protein